MVRNVLIVSVLAQCLYTGNISAQSFIVENGEARAEIVIDENPLRMVAMAALELQYYLEKISGARLPVSTIPGETNPVKIYIGKSPYTDSLGINGEELKYGAFRMVSGENWLVLLGRDYDYAPPEPWPRKHSDRPRAIAEWDELTTELAGRQWGYPFYHTYKDWWNPRDYNAIMSDRYGSENKNIWNPRNLSWSIEYQGPGAGAGFWLQDEGGSLNAVYGFLRSLGVRWYMPGQEGEVLPEQKSIPLPSVDTMVHPDFAIRYYTWANYAGFPLEDVIWARRTGMNSYREVLGDISYGYAHKLTLVHSRTPMKLAHPEYYAKINGVRDTSHRGYGTPCLLSGGLMQEAVKFARFMFDQYDQPHISMWPGDAFMQCQCDSCKGMSPSDLVWSFIDTVARELFKSHPDRLVSCGAYTPYVWPPDSVGRFTPNVVVFIANADRPGFNDTGRWNTYWNQVEGWREKVAPGNIMRVENHTFGIGYGNRDEPVPFPLIYPHPMARDLRALNGISRGECGEVSQVDMHWHAPGTNHLNWYVQARFLWDANQDIDSLLEEYYTLFYGPVREKIKTAFEYAESSYECIVEDPIRNRCKVKDMSKLDLSVRIHFLELLHAALDSAGETVYGRRIQTILDELTPLDSLLLLVKEKATLTVVDRATGEPVYRAEIRYGENITGTDFSGKAVMDGLGPGRWIYNVEHDAYFPLTDSLVITGDTSLVVVLTRKLAEIRFEVSDSSGPVPGAEVILSGWKKLTGSDGIAWFSNQVSRHSYGYTIELGGYQSVRDSLYLDIDTTVTVILQPATGIDAYAITKAAVFPNPASGRIHIRLESQHAGILIMNPEGKVMAGRRIYRGLNVMDVSGIAPGLYFLRIQTREGIEHRKVMLE
jgi:hypothetical protein